MQLNFAQYILQAFCVQWALITLITLTSYLLLWFQREGRDMVHKVVQSCFNRA